MKVKKRRKDDYRELVTSIELLLLKAKEQAAKEINYLLVQTYWQIGKFIIEFEQRGKGRAEYGAQVLDRLSKDLTAKFGKGFGRSNLVYIRQLYLTYSKSGTLSHQLGWSHYYELLKIDNPLERGFYEQQSIKENWSIRELKRQKQSALFQRLALSKDKKGFLKLAKEGQQIQHPNDLFRDPYIFEFLQLPERNLYSETDIEAELISNLQHFILELGKGFAFIGRQYRMTLANRHYHVDLVFYHRILKCFVLIDLKKGEVLHEDIGQMNMYLNYFKKEENVADDREPIGIILSTAKDKVLVEYALGGITNKLFVSKYQLYLPDKRLLEKEVRHILEQHEE
jgi:predicted nuclease of restriction endonuclease-like (RecB) superfamily